MRSSWLHKLMKRATQVFRRPGRKKAGKPSRSFLVEQLEGRLVPAIGGLQERFVAQAYLDVMSKVARAHPRVSSTPA